MTDTDLREAMHRLRDSIPVPPVDHVKFQRRVRQARRRTRTRAAIGGAAAVAALAFAGLTVPGNLVGNDDPNPPSSQTAVDIGPAYPLPYISGNRLLLAMPDGTTVQTDVGAQEVLGQTDTEIVYSTNRSHLVARTVDAAGRVGDERRLATNPVRSAVASPDGTTVAYIDLDDSLHIRHLDQPATAPDLITSTTRRDQILVDTDGDRWLLFDYDTEAVTLHRSTSGAETQVALDIDSVSTFGNVAGDTVTVNTGEGALAFDAATGARERVLEPATMSFALSPDGTRYAAEASRTGSLVLADILNGDRRQVTGIPDDAGVIGQVFWQTNTRFYASTSNSDGTALWSCTVNADCARLTDLVVRDVIIREVGPMQGSATLPFG